MPTIAQKLCHEVVEPILVPSSNEIPRTIQSRKPFKSISGNSIRFAKPTKSIIIEKQKTIKQLEPTSKTVLNKLISKDKISRKDFTDTAVNTLISGPLRCDNNCVTNVRRRDINCNCKQKKTYNFKASSKQVQTLNNSCSRSDKACTHAVNMANCGTQFMENINTRLRTQISNRLLVKKSNEFLQQFRYKNTAHAHLTPPVGNNNRAFNANTCRKRWALSNYPTRGPDF